MDYWTQSDDPFLVPHTSNEVSVLAQLMVPSNCKNKHICVWGLDADFCCPSLGSIQAVQDYSCVSLLLRALKMLHIHAIWEDILPWSDYEYLGLCVKVLESFLCKVDSQLFFCTVTWEELFYWHFSHWCVVFYMVSCRGFATLSPLTCGLLQWKCEIVAVKHYVNLIIIFGLTVQCGCEVVSPLGTCSDPWWLTHCVYYWHSIHDNHILGWQGTTLGGSIL